MTADPTIHWCSLIQPATASVRAALAELGRMLPPLCPRLPPLALAELTAEERQHLPALVMRPPLGFDAGGRAANPLDNKLVFAYCRGDEDFVAVARAQNPDAEWGVALPGVFALAWMPANKHLIWHEALHLLHAQDCYDQCGRATCEDPRCVMQYEPTATNCGGGLSVCSANIERIGCQFA